MAHVKQFEIKLEDGERRLLSAADLKRGTLVYYSELGAGFGMEAVVEIHPLPETPEPTPDKKQVEYDILPDDFLAHVFFTDDRDWEIWGGAIDTAGQIRYLIDTNGKQYHTLAALKDAGVKRVTLETQHIFWVAFEKDA